MGSLRGSAWRYNQATGAGVRFKWASDYARYINGL